jgi:hypothetical protein
MSKCVYLQHGNKIPLSIIKTEETATITDIEHLKLELQHKYVRNNVTTMNMHNQSFTISHWALLGLSNQAKLDEQSM